MNTREKIVVDKAANRSGPRHEHARLPAPSRHRRLLHIAAITAVVCAIGAAIGIRWYRAAGFVNTDNAQIEGTILPVRAKLPGVIDEVAVADNMIVRQGALLLRLRDVEFRQRVERARAELQAMQAAAGRGDAPGSLDSELRAAAANQEASAALADQLQVQWRNARTEYERIDALRRRNLVSERQRDEALTQMQALEHQLAAARNSARAAGAGTSARSAELKIHQYRIAAAKAELELAEVQLDDSRQFAPRDAIVARKDVEVGQFVLAGQRLLNLVALDDLWVIANIKETEIGRVRNGQRATVTVDAYPDQPLTGVVQSDEPATGAKFSLLPQENATGNFTKVVQRVPVKIRLDRNRQFAALRLRPGMSVLVDIDVRASQDRQAKPADRPPP